jgi:hypothetical protein
VKAAAKKAGENSAAKAEGAEIMAGIISWLAAALRENTESACEENQWRLSAEMYQ